MLGPNGKPTPRARAYAERELLLGRLERLQDLERVFKQSTDNQERIRADAVAIAREHLEQAIDALEVASRE